MPDDADETLDGVPPTFRLPPERVELPIYRPRHRLTRAFVLSFLLAAITAGLLVLLVLYVVR